MNGSALLVSFSFGVFLRPPPHPLACVLACKVAGKEPSHTPLFPFLMYINSPRIAFGPLKPHATFVKGSCEVHTHAGVCCVLCVFFFSLFFFFCLPQLLELFFFLFLPPKQSANAAFFPYCTYTFGHWLLFFPPFFFTIYVLSFVLSHSLYTSFHRSSLFFFLSIYVTAYFYALFFFSHPFPFFLIDCSASQPFSPCLSRRHHSVFSPCDFGARFCVCATLMMCFA